MASTINATTTGAGGIIYTADASGVLQLQANATNALTVEANAAITINNSLNVSGNIVSTRGTVTSLVSATAQATTSGTSIDFTGIPNWIKRVTVMFNGVSTNGTSLKLIQLGSGSAQTTGYISTSSFIGSTVGVTSNTFGFVIYSNQAAEVISGHMIITNVSGNVWISSHTVKDSTSFVACGGGDVTLTGTLDRVRLTTVNGTDVFDAGSINILYE